MVRPVARLLAVALPVWLGEDRRERVMDARSLDLAGVERAVVAAEARTCAEIVCAVATASGRYDRADSVVGLGGALLGLVAASAAHADGQWGGAGAPLWIEAGAVTIGFVLGTMIGELAPALRRPLVSEREQADEVARAASHVFSVQRVTATRRAGGVLVYCSLFEHRVVVQADDGALAALGQGTVDAARDAAVARLRDEDVAGGLIAAIELLADRLAHTLPKDADDTDELPNHVRVFHPRP